MSLKIQKVSILKNYNNKSLQFLKNEVEQLPAQRVSLMSDLLETSAKLSTVNLFLNNLPFIPQSPFLKYQIN